MHLVTLATADEVGHPCARTVVLRGVDPTEGTVRIHTDRRSPKVAHLRANPTCELLAYDPQARRQIRIRAASQIVTEGELFERVWANTPTRSRRCYLAPHPPSARTDGPTPNLPEAFRSTDPDEAASESGKRHFAVILASIQHIDVLDLAHDGHRRCRFDLRACTGVSASWLAP